MEVLRSARMEGKGDHQATDYVSKQWVGMNPVEGASSGRVGATHINFNPRTEELDLPHINSRKDFSSKSYGGEDSLVMS